MCESWTGIVNLAPVESELFSGPAERDIQGMKGRIGHLDDWVAETPESIAAQALKREERSGAGATDEGFTVGAQTPGVGSTFFWFSLVVFFVCWIPLVMCCRRSGLYSEATGRVLKEYGTRLRADLLRHQPVARRERFTQPAISRIG